MPEVLNVALNMRERVTAIALLDTMKHVYRSGRIPKIAAKVGSMLSIRPIFTVSDVVHFASAVRNKKRGIERLLQMMRDKVGDKATHIAVMHAYALEEAEKLKERVAAEFKCAELWLTEFSPLMGYACGTGTLGLAFYAED
jgi:DegV family protein with EDD domain